MKKKGTKIEEQAKFIEKEYQKNLEQLESKEEYLRVKKLLEKVSSSNEKKFTYTIGEMNAYLG